MENFLQELKSKVKVALVGGSDLVKIAEQMGGDDGKSEFRPPDKSVFENYFSYYSTKTYVVGTQ